MSREILLLVDALAHEKNVGRDLKFHLSHVAVLEMLVIFMKHLLRQILKH